MKTYRIGLQLYSVRGDLYKDFEGTLRAVSEMGYDCVEFAGLCGKSACEVKELCARYGLDPVSAHVPLSEMAADPDGVFALYREIGCRYIAVPYLPAQDRPLTPGYEKTVNTIAFLAGKAAQHGLSLMYHNHDFEFVRLENGEYAFDMLFSAIPALNAEIDTCWVNVAGEDPAAYLRKYAGRIPVVHFKDFVSTGRTSGNLYNLIGMEESEKEEESAFSFMPVGYGVQNVPGMLEALEDSNCAYVIVEQDEPSLEKSPLECASMSISYLRSLER